MSDDATTTPHGGDAGADEPDVGQTSTEDLPAGEGLDMGEDRAAEQGSAARDDDMASGHLGEPGGPAWARTEGDG